MGFYEVIATCAGDYYLDNYFRSYADAVEYIEKFRPYVDGMTDDYFSQIKECGLSFSVYSPDGDCVLRKSRTFENLDRS